MKESGQSRRTVRPHDDLGAPEVGLEHKLLASQPDRRWHLPRPSAIAAPQRNHIRLTAPPGRRAFNLPTQTAN